MARPVPQPRRDRPPTRPQHSYEGFVEKRGPWDQCYKRVWAGLRGLSLAFYRHPRDCEPLEVLDLGDLVAVRAERGDLVLRLRGQGQGEGQQVMLKAESWEEQEMWRGFILTMAEMKVPADLMLLPGHLFQLLEALREEQDRRATPGSPTTPGSPATPSAPEPPVPSCFFGVTRTEAERLLEQSAGVGGNMVLRPGGHGQGVSVTTRQEMNGTVLLKHYRVKCVDQGYVIDVDTQHRCSSLDEVVQYFVESSKGSLQPLHREYCMRLEFVETDGENGEETQKTVFEPPRAAPKPQPRAALKPSPSPRRPVLQPPGGPKGPPQSGAAAEEQSCRTEQDKRHPPKVPPRPDPHRAPLPPHNHGMLEELTEKLQRRRALIGD